MKKDVLISIIGKQIRDGESDEIEFTTKGDFYIKNQKYYLKYQESETTGFDGSTTTLKFDGKNSISMIRSGKIRSHLIIEKGKRNLCLYDTGYGELTIGIFGNQIKSDLNENGGNISFTYTMDINTDLDSQNEINICVSEHKM